MKKFKVYVYREWIEHGEVVVFADNKVEASIYAKTILENDEDVYWSSENMEIVAQSVDLVKEIV